ncbi:hypothetical protein PWEIH_04531 [Listeria weihenstephanensis FSL R9-0317]|uniref:precorrin-2 dehydrogenase n=1 Tax=Listeria weihenstephanensis TaxID=1006155 RepID=A0A1S7FQW8_9LIST|nr:bifunctional precorrin-2 dehydrogenase/sirohydrochlorin ferrochelatase [Listeria weihenstephanensis]AQY49828.1 hypothetical protein UE46_01295 [Listeria weihenstephanensis]EUJ40318.1 hypothetical protein PWEIH_04531 [Listeria weihenstephanensis FSL R9-0317]
MTNVGYPVLLQLTNKKVAIIGGGKIATKKAHNLLPTGATITVIAPTFTEELQQMPVQRITGNYEASHIKDALLIFCCTNDPKVNAQITHDALPHQLVNDCTDKSRSDFFNMATVQKEDHLIAISTHGSNPTRSKEIRRIIERSADF